MFTRPRLIRFQKRLTAMFNLQSFQLILCGNIMFSFLYMMRFARLSCFYQPWNCLSFKCKNIPDLPYLRKTNVRTLSFTSSKKSLIASYLQVQTNILEAILNTVFLSSGANYKLKYPTQKKIPNCVAVPGKRPSHWFPVIKTEWLRQHKS